MSNKNIKKKEKMNDYKKVMLISPDKVKSRALVGLNLDDGTLGECIRIAHIHVREVIGRNLMEHLQELVWNKIQGSGSTIDDDENIAYKTLLEEYLTDALAYATAVEAATVNELKIRNMGTVKNSDTNVINAGDDYKHLSVYLRTYLNDAYNRMVEFLCEERAAFAELPDGYCTCESKPLYANINLWLGPVKK